ncbi:MAG TPA: hypothetical protein VH682_11700 [Gemmataceae bacterium]|jgi:hypothetical protein
MFARWLGKLTKSSGKQARRPMARQGRFGRKLFLEVLEDRTVLSPLLLTVDSLSDAGTGSGMTGDLRYCIRLANQNNNTGSTPDQIIFASGLQGTINLQQGELDITDPNLVITGPGSSTIAVSGNKQSRVFSIVAGVTAEIDDLTITNGLATQGGGIDNAGDLTLSQCILSDNQAVSASGSGQGGGLFNEAGASLHLTQSTLASNQATGNPAIGSNNQGGQGGGLYNEGTAIIDDSTLTQNVAMSSFGAGAVGGAAGGAIWNGDESGSSRATLTITYSTLSQNEAVGAAGTVGANARGGNALGGALLNFSGDVTISYSTLTDNQALGGSASSQGAAGAFGGGGAIRNDTGNLTIDHSILSSNRATGGDPGQGGIGGLGDAGALFNNIATATLTDDTFSDNQATGGAGNQGIGGAIYNAASSVEITGGLFTRNQALSGTGGSGGFGGAINTAGSVTSITGSTFTFNEALGGNASGLGAGGAIRIAGGRATVTDSTITDNQAIGGAGSPGQAGGNGLGGGIMNTFNGTLEVSFTTIAHNAAIGGTGGTGGAGGNGEGAASRMVLPRAAG